MRPPVGRFQDLGEALRAYACTHDQVLRDEIVVSEMPLVFQLARRFANRGEALEDLVQAGSIGLVNAVERFDSSLGYAFGAYATSTIVGEIKRHFRDRAWSVRAPRAIQELYLRLGPVVDEMSQRLGRPPTVAEMALETGATEGDLAEALQAGHAYRSMSIDAPNAYDATLAQSLGDLDRELERADDRIGLAAILNLLPERDRLIVRLRFMDDLTQSEIAARVGLSQMHVSRLLARSLAELRSLYASAC
ncbi:MAG: SigB/SigF/SigG family RNA polymerase sigma factor [Acidimicrobiales bacterium]